MTITHFKEFLNTLPAEFDSCEIVYSEFGMVDESLARKDTPIALLAIDEDTNELLMISRKNADKLYEYEAETEGN